MPSPASPVNVEVPTCTNTQTEENAYNDHDDGGTDSASSVDGDALLLPHGPPCSPPVAPVGSSPSSIAMATAATHGRTNVRRRRRAHRPIPERERSTSAVPPKRHILKKANILSVVLTRL